MIGELLQRITAALDAKEIPYMLTGSVASSLYGMPRMTNDIDLVIAPQRDQLLAMVQLLQRVGFTVIQEQALGAFKKRTQFNVLDLPRGLKVDLILQKDREFSRVEFERRATHEVEGMRLTIATPEDVVLAKLEWAKMGESEQQLIDAAGILRVQRNRLDMTYIETWIKRLALQEQWDAARAKAT